MQITVGELSKLLNAEVIGDAGAIISKVAKIEEGEPQALSFLSNLKYEPHLYSTGSTAVLVNKTFVPSKPVQTTLIKVDDAYSSFTFLLEKFGSRVSKKSGIDAGATVSATASVGKDVYIGPYSVVEDGAVIGRGTQISAQCHIGEKVNIGENVLIYPGVKIYHECVIGNNCIIHSGAVVGSDGFGFAPQPDGSYRKIPQTGNVIIEDDVELGANCAIDRATMGSTIIRKGAKLDNLVQVAHNVEIGEHTVIAAQTGIAGSTRIGKHCIIAGQVGFVGHLTIADRSVIGAQSGIHNSITEPGRKWFHSPAFELKGALKSSILFKQLPDFEKRIRELEELIKKKEESK